MSQENLPKVDVDSYWAEQAKRLNWFQPFSSVNQSSFDPPVRIEWYTDGKLNLSYNCLDRHLEQFGDKTAMIWEPDQPDFPASRMSFRELHEQVCRMANVLKSQGVKKGEFVTIYMPMIPEVAIAMLACSRIGAPHSVVFGGFAPDALADRINDCKSRFLITADHGWRGGKIIPLKKNVSAALLKAPGVEKVFVVNHPRKATLPQDLAPIDSTRDVDLKAAISRASNDCPAEVMDAEDPLFILYTSGSTGKPKGVLHTTGGYSVYVATTHATVFDTDGHTRPDDVYWCTADVGWVTGHSYLVYGPLLNATTTLMFEGVPNSPSASRLWEVVDKHQVSIFYTAPTAIRALMREGEAPVKAASRKSLRILGSVGEPINPEAWNWYHRVVGEERCPIVDTWWQTETGGILISALPNQTKLKPGSATRPLPTIEPCLVDEHGAVLEGVASGNLCITQSWPGQMRTIYGDHARFEQSYFGTYPGKYFTGDGAHRDEDGYYWITGRVDDVLNVSGHRLGTAEIESALVSHPAVAEAAVVGYPHEIKGHGIYAFVVLKNGQSPSDALSKELILHVRKEIGAIAQPELLQWASSGLPKTRSGKIMRRILRMIAEDELGSLGDLSTLADSNVVQALIDGRINRALRRDKSHEGRD